METLITFKTAKLARRKNFSQLDYPRYGQDGEIHTVSWFISNYKQKGYYAPTQSVLANWLLEKHELFVTVELAYNEWGRYSCSVYKKSKKNTQGIPAIDGSTIFDNPIEAYEEGLFQALNLI